MIIGAWRSLVAHLHGVQGVGGSNPLAPILHRRLMLNYFTPSWLLFPMLLLSILAHFHSNTVRSLERRPSTMGARPITQGRAKEAKNHKVGKRKLGVASSANLLDNTACLF